MSAAPKPVPSMPLSLHVTDPVVVEYLSAFDEDVREDKALEALKVGAIAIQSASPTLDTTVVERTFGQVEKQIDDRLDAFDEELRTRLEEYFREGGAVPGLIERHLGERGELARVLDSRVGPGSSLDPRNSEGLVQALTTMVSEILADNRQKVLASFSLDDETSSLSRLKRALREEIEELRRQTREDYSEIREALGTERGKQEEAEKGTAKGKAFEDALYERLAQLARSLDDTSENVGGTPGELPRSKVGDYVVHLGETSAAPGRTIVIEAKMKGGYNLRSIREELETAKKNRSADIGIFAFCKGYEPPEVGDFLRTGSDFVVTVDEQSLASGHDTLYLEAAYKVARALITLKASEEEKREIDTTYLRSELDHIETSLELASDIATKLTTIQNSSSAIEKNLRKLLDALSEHLANIRSHLPS